MKSLIPRFNAQRMVMDYVQKFYAPAKHQRQALARDGGAPARQLAAWKQRAAACWPNVSIRRIDNVVERIQADSTVPIDMAAKLDGLDAEDVVVECLVGTCDTDGKFLPHRSYPLQVNGHTQDGETLFHLDLCTDLPGLQSYQLRIYPYHKLLSHRFELGLMRWL